MNSTLSNNFVVERGDDGGEYVADEMNLCYYIKDEHRQYKTSPQAKRHELSLQVTF